MSNESVIVIEKRMRLSVDTARVCVEGADKTKTYIPGCDIAALILAHPAITLSSAVFQLLSDNGAVVLTVDNGYMPSSIALPLNKNFFGAKRPFQQAKILNTPLAQKIWDTTIQAKICGQASVISAENPAVAKELRKMAMQIRKYGNNCEGIAAKLYWDVFFTMIGKDTMKREKQGAADIVNSCLNYGYAILRSAVARSFAASGFCLNFGIGHCRKDNPCNLADDFIEPFRYLAEIATLKVIKQHPHAEELNSRLKREVINSVLESKVIIANREYRLFSAIEYVAESFGKFLEDNRRNIHLPNLSKLKRP